MKNHNLEKLDQTDAALLLARLSLHCAHCRGLVHTSEGQLIAAPALTGNVSEGLFQDIRLLENHATELETRLGGLAPAFVSPVAQTKNNSNSESAAPDNAMAHDLDSITAAARKGDRKATAKLNLLNDLSRFERESANFPLASTSGRILAKKISTTKAQLAALN